MCRRKEEGGDIPFFIFGHSMGSLVCTSLSYRLQNEKHINFKGYITSGLALDGGHGACRPLGIKCLTPLVYTPFGIYLAKLAKRYAPFAPNSPVQNWCCIKDKERQKQNANDPLVIHKWILNRAGANALLSCEDIMNNAPNITTPYLALHGEEDVVCFPSSSIKYIDRMVLCIDKTYYPVKGGFHEIFYDIGYEINAKYMTNWIIKRR